METKGLSKKYTFKEAVPVWKDGEELTKNRSLAFRCVVKGNDEIKLCITSHSRYQIFINGKFYAAGPARAGHDYYRVSEYTLKNELSDNFSIISIIAAGYNINSFYLVNRPSFICAEILRENETLFATGRDDCEAEVYTQRIIKCPRYSFQRPFMECYNLSDDFSRFMTDKDYTVNKVKLIKTQGKNFLQRNLPFCLYTKKDAEMILSKGVMEEAKVKKVFEDRSLTGICDEILGYEEKDLDVNPVNEIYRYNTKISEDINSPFKTADIAKDSCVICDMGRNNTGYIHLEINAHEDSEFYIVFNSILPDGVCPDPGKDSCENVIKWVLKGDRKYSLTSFEPYTYRYIQLISIGGSVSVNDVSLYEECYPETGIVNTKKMPTDNLQKIYDAAVETFRQNATDIFMDCPSRERAGWLCDSYFTSRVEKELTGESFVERCFLENFIFPEKFEHIPEGMLPMCYPSDHYDKIYIHNWAFWFVLELKEYFDRTGDEELICAAKNRVYKLLKFSETYENADGLLQNVGSWVFVEWSEANDYVQDINYPSNMLYSKVLDSVAELYKDDSLYEKAQKLRKTIIEKSFDGKFFCDNSVLEENKIAIRTTNCSETCQYYAFFTGTATKETFPELYETMFTQFGPHRINNNKYPHIPFSNAFIGNYLRLFILFEQGEHKKLREEIESFFLPMAEKTGTLWENMTDYASCCHGFASHVAYWLNKIIGH